MTTFPVLGPVRHHRRPLQRSRSALDAGCLTVGFLGGSITAPKTGTRWPEPFTGWLVQRFPGARFVFENAALGATGSDLAVFRAEPEIIARVCDLVFVEYAVNDIGTSMTLRNCTRDGLLRQLMASGADVVLVYTFYAEMLADMEAGRVPPSVAELEALAGHYSLGSIWAGLHAWTEVCRGLMTWRDWLPDGLHPEQRGSLSYAQAIIAFCAEELGGDLTDRHRQERLTMPAALQADCWDKFSRCDLTTLELTGPWSLHRWFTCLGMARALTTNVPGATLRCAFEGRGFVLGFDFGRLSGEVRYRVDGGEWRQTERDRPDWCGDSGWYRPTLVAVPGGRGTVTTIGLVGVIH
ncbi:MAG: hypothetical protein RLZZ129_1702 [Verrucomicrobiota bacterium]|jgi:hypothetical protein